MNYDVYLGGIVSKKWRDEFKKNIDADISVFDPRLNKFSTKNLPDKSEQLAREFYFMDICQIIVFYFNQSSSKSTRVQLGDCVGSKKQVIVCLDGEVPGKAYLELYCEYRGIPVTKTLEELVVTVEEYLAQLELSKTNDTEENIQTEV